jgi:hypothetical protein
VPALKEVVDLPWVFSFRSLRVGQSRLSGAGD